MVSYIEENEEDMNWIEFAEWVYEVSDEEGYSWTDNIIDDLDEELYLKY